MSLKMKHDCMKVYMYLCVREHCLAASLLGTKWTSILYPSPCLTDTFFVCLLLISVLSRLETNIILKYLCGLQVIGRQQKSYCVVNVTICEQWNVTEMYLW